MVPHERSLVNHFKNRPFALVGVECYDDEKTAKAFAKEHNVNWRSFLDQKGAIAKEWNVNGFPTMMLIDHEGKIVSKEFYMAETGIDSRLEDLVKKAESALKK